MAGRRFANVPGRFANVEQTAKNYVIRPIFGISPNVRDFEFRTNVPFIARRNKTQHTVYSTLRLFPGKADFPLS